MAYKLPIQTVVEEAWNKDPRYQLWNPSQNKDSIQEGVTMTLPVLSGLKALAESREKEIAVVTMTLPVLSGLKDSLPCTKESAGQVTMTLPVLSGLKEQYIEAIRKLG
ncbi:MAG: hypothetical protein V7K84_26120 [Nostoc sp.]